MRENSCCSINQLFKASFGKCGESVFVLNKCHFEDVRLKLGRSAICGLSELSYLNLQLFYGPNN